MKSSTSEIGLTMICKEFLKMFFILCRYTDYKILLECLLYLCLLPTFKHLAGQTIRKLIILGNIRKIT